MTPRLVLLGGVLGLAWAAGLRGFMAEVAGPDSAVHWYGTFGQVLLPGVITGSLLGWAEAVRRQGGRRGWRWLALAPLSFTVTLLVSPEVLDDLQAGTVPFSDGIGLGAVAIPLFAMAGGFALSGRGPVAARVLAGLVAVVPVPAWIWATTFFPPDLSLTTPHGAWVALLFWSSIAALSLACAIPHRPPGGPPT
jgi:hypothetical protein